MKGSQESPSTRKLDASGLSLLTLVFGFQAVPS